MTEKKPVARFISFEGGEGSGKSTQARKLFNMLKSRGIDALTTREPGGSPGAEEIRKLLVTGNPDRWLPMSEALLFVAARFDHIERVIRPNLHQGRWVISDRFVHSSLAYQGDARGLGQSTIKQLHQFAGANLEPDLTFVLDVDPVVGLERANKRRGNETRFHEFNLDFHKKLRQSYQHIALTCPRVAIIDTTSLSEYEVAGIVYSQVIGWFKLEP